MSVASILQAKGGPFQDDEVGLPSQSALIEWPCAPQAVWVV